MFIAFILLAILAGFVLAAILTSRIFWLGVAAVVGALVVDHFATQILVLIAVGVGLAVLAVVGLLVWNGTRPPALPAEDPAEQDRPYMPAL